MQFMTMGLFCFLSLVNLYFLLSIKFEFDRPKRLQQQIESSQSTSATTIINGRCQCEIVSLDCLESIACIPRGVDLQESIAEGTYIRNLIRKMATVEGEGQPWPSDPLGKATQYTTIEAYLNWSNKGVLNPMESFSTFVNSSVYPDCVEKNLESKDCFFHAIDETDYIDPIEEYANKQNAVTEENKKSLKMELEFFRKKNKYEGNTLSAKSHLMVFAHLCRIYFNIRDPIIESYKKHLKIIHAEDSPEEMSSGSKSQGDILRVSLHVRRADSCEHEKEGFGQRYLDKPSEFNSTAQVSGKRFCYNTAVYMNAVQKAKELAGSPSLEVYLSTDYAGELMNEIREQFPDLYRSTTWKYMNFPRDTFDYDAFIEAGDHHDHKKPFLGETAVDDLWHLSHGQVFIGHLGKYFRCLILNRFFHSSIY